MEICLELQDISVQIGKKEVLRHISLPFRKRRITAIIGMSGCGKTTLLKLLNRSLANRQMEVRGQVLWEGMDLHDLPIQRVRRLIGLIYQKPVVFPFSIIHNMTYALQYYGITDKMEQEHIVRNCLRQVGLYDEICSDLDRDARELSGGQQQRLCIARTLAVNPQVLLLDEPCSALDIHNMLVVEDTLRQIRDTCTVIIVTHNLSQARRIADYTLYMEDGQIVEYAETPALFEKPRQRRTQQYLAYIH